MRNIFIVGATGSIGTQTIDVLKNLKDRYRLSGISARRNTEGLIKIWKEFKPEYILIRDKEKIDILKENTEAKTLSFEEGFEEILSNKEIDTIFFSSSGIDDIKWIILSIKHGKRVFISNKESFVAGGELIVNELKKKGETLIPIDSEHSAIFQLLENKKRKEVEKIILTASGGAFFGKKQDELVNVRPEDALKHPTWRMGKKITIDSATLFNKGMEVIEAHLFFNFPFEKIDVVIHKESIIHSLIEMVDGHVFALLSYPDMRYPIKYALTYPDRIKNDFKRFKFNKNLSFYPFDKEIFPCFEIIVEAGKMGGTLPSSIIYADEILVNLFIQKKIGFHDTPKLLEKVYNNVKRTNLSIEFIEDVKKEVRDIIEREVKHCI
ncbi:MAG: 1-deoxy-D-xylulose-5-phosphate reductoisomerase [Caldiserica bacterium]|nr:MAG: 1-deoxy-D-xylulose-5-phosphate reductoisomerase [Caldisericota bacterium]